MKALGRLLLTAIAATALTACGALGEPRPEVLLDSEETPVENYWKLIEGAEPSYPEEAARRQLEGKVQVLVTIGQDGRAAEIRVIEAEPAGLFVPSVVQALDRFRWEPTADNENRQPVMTEFVFEFRRE
jgi:TonB family protein